jgi:hypothetical protein
MPNLASNPWGAPNSAAFHATRALESTGAASTLTPSATTTTTSGVTTPTEAMTVTVASNASFAVGDVVKIAGNTNAWVVTSKPTDALAVRRYMGTDAATMASGAVVTKQTVS